jgi:serine protease AprX
MGARGLHVDHPHAPNKFAVLSTSARVASPHDLAGRGVTIAFLDSGFTAHPDLTTPVNRIVAYHDVHEPSRELDPSGPSEPDAWHGTQTAVVAAGNGFLSDGAYRGLAHDARVVLVRVGREGRVSEESIEKGLLWVLENAERYAIRVVSMSLGGDSERPLAECPVNRLAEEAVARGLVLVAAAGNSGCGEAHRCLPPASAPSVIAVGGYDDSNDPERRRLSLYCSSFGVTPDGVVKPELIAPAAWVAAPILPGTEAQRDAEALSGLAAAPGHRLPEALAEAGLLEVAAAAADGAVDPETVRAAAEEELRERKIVAAHYQHVDGTSFAAPIAASVVAQMLEANPALTPADVRRILLRTAEPVGGEPAIRQGYGILNGRAAVEAAFAESHPGRPAEPPRLAPGRVAFAFHDDAARTVAVACSFTGWDPVCHVLVQDEGGVWRAEVPSPPPGRHRYKIVVDGGRWIADPDNHLREPDPYGGWDSVLEVP